LPLASLRDETKAEQRSLDGTIHERRILLAHSLCTTGRWRVRSVRALESHLIDCLLAMGPQSIPAYRITRFAPDGRQDFWSLSSLT
jgi:hypothetical protein